MVEKQQVIKEEVESSGLFDFQSFYKFAHNWLKTKEYGVNEDKYEEKLSGNKRDLKVEWLASKNLNDYFRYENKIKIKVSGMTDVEAEIDGKKTKTNQGKITLEIIGFLVKDRKNKWEESPLWRFARDTYNKYVIPQKIEQVSKELMTDVIDSKDEMKTFLELVGKR